MADAVHLTENRALWQRSEDPLLVAAREIAKGIAATRDAMAFETNPAVLGDAMCEIAGLTTELDALRIELAAQCEANGVPKTIGVRTVGQYVAARTNNASIDTSLDVSLARWVRDFPIFAEALACRDLTLRHLRLMRSKLDNDRTRTLLKGDQRFFADAGRDTDFAGFEKVCETWIGIVDSDGKEPLDQLEKSGVSITVGSGGRTKITIESDAISGSAFARMIEHEARKLRKQDQTNGVQRTDRQRRHAAALALTIRGFARDDGSYPFPLFNIVMSMTVAEWTIHKMADPNCDCEHCQSVPVHPFDIDGRCELITGQPVHPLLVAAVLGLPAPDVAQLRRYVMDAKSRIVDYSYNARTAPEHLRTASMIEHHSACTIPGCDAPHHWLHIDHIDPVDNGGRTQLRNLEPKCEPDNLEKAAQTGHTPAKDKPPPPRYRPHQHQDRSTEGDDPDGDHDRWI